MTAADCPPNSGGNNNEPTAANSPTPPALQVQAHQQQTQSSTLLQSSSSSNSTTSSSHHGGGHHSASRSPEPKISFHLKTSIFTRRITIDSDKMALGLIKQLAIGFLNEIYFQHSYPPQSYIGDYLKRHYNANDPLQLQSLYERIILRKYSANQDTFLPFYSVGDIVQDSYISIEISERQLNTSGGGGNAMPTSSSTSALNNTTSPATTTPSSGSGSCSSQLTQLKISHDFHTESYFMPTHCASCSALIKGVFKQGFQCANCKKNYCPKCKLKAEATGEGCLAALAGPQPPPTPSISHHQQLLPTVSSSADSGISSSTTNATAPSSSQANNNNNQINCDTTTKLDISGAHVNMAKRKSASNLLHFNIANPFKSHHSGNNQQQTTSQQQSSVCSTPVKHESEQVRGGSSSKSMRSSAGALDPILQQLSKQMLMQQTKQEAVNSPSKLVMTAADEHQQRCSTNLQATGAAPASQQSKLLNIQAAQLSSSHQNLYSIPSASCDLTSEDKNKPSEVQDGSASARESPTKPNVRHQLSNSARNSARDLLHSSPTRRDVHSFISMDWIQVSNDTLCGVCNKPLVGSGTSGAGANPPARRQSSAHSALMCKTCKLQVHAYCQDLALADCLDRVTESSRAAATSGSGGGGGGGANDSDQPQTIQQQQQQLKNTNSNVSRDNIRLHRLAPSVKHVKRPDLTRPIIEGWLQHKTLSDEQSRRHYWRLDDTDITLYENDTSTRYFKAIALNKITRVISASSLPKQIKEDVALGSPNRKVVNDHQQQQQQAKSANTSPTKTPEFKAQMAAVFAFEVATGSVYLVQATDQSEAARWRGSLEAITGAKRATGEQVKSSDKPEAVAAQAPGKAGDQPEVLKEVQASVAQQANKPQQQQQQVSTKPTTPARGHHHHHHHHHHHQTGSGSGAGGTGGHNYRGQHKTYTDPNRSRLYNRPRIVIKLDPMSIPDHWIEGKYLIERNRSKGVGFEELGSGQFGKVYAAISEIKADDSTRGLWSGVPVAIKEISKARFDLRQQAKLKNEANILSRLDHPGVIILERVHDLPDKLYIVMEQLEDDMLEMIVSTQEKRLSERVTKFLTYQILEALKYLHSQNIAHCDLKPENVLLCERRSQFPQIKLCDFGFAKIIEENSFRSSLVGTPAYLAPEVVKGERYNRSVDLWSVGVIVYVSLSGEFPFNEGENIHDQISRANFMYPDQPWARISSQAKSFINSLLRVNSDRRLSANRAQMDDWIQDFQLWCDLCELELRVGRRWVTDDADFERWSRYARQHHLQVPRSAVQLHQELNGD